jgi:hypothetical protein
VANLIESFYNWFMAASLEFKMNSRVRGCGSLQCRFPLTLSTIYTTSEALVTMFLCPDKTSTCSRLSPKECFLSESQCHMLCYTLRILSLLISWGKLVENAKHGIAIDSWYNGGRAFPWIPPGTMHVHVQLHTQSRYRSRRLLYHRVHTFSGP